MNKNSFYKQKSKDFLPSKLYGKEYGSGSPPSKGGMGAISGVSANRGASSYFNKNSGGPMGSSGGGNAGLPSLSNTKGGIMANNPNPGLGSYGGGSTFGGISKNQVGGSHPQGPPAFPSYKYGGLGGGIGGGLGGADPYNANYQQNSQGAQGSIGSSGSGVRGGGAALGSRGSDFKLPSVSNKMAMGGMRGLPGMPGSKGG